MPYQKAMGIPIDRLTCHDLACVRGARLLFQRLSFGLNSGEILWLWGENGVGKTSLLRLLAGLAQPYQGSICLNGQHNQQHSQDEDYPLQIGYLATRAPMKAELSVIENLEFWTSIYEKNLEDMQQALYGFGLEGRKNQPFGDLSTGFKKRLDLARLSLLKARPLWLMDEPLNGLDKPSREIWQDMVSDYCAKGGMVLVVSHENLPLDATKTLELTRC